MGESGIYKNAGENADRRLHLPDHRGDSVYQSWEDNAQYIAAYARDGRLTQGVTPEEAASLLLNPDYTCAVSVSGNGGTVFAYILKCAADNAITISFDTWHFFAASGTKTFDICL